MHSLRYSISFLLGTLLSYQIIPAYSSSVAVAPSTKMPIHGTADHSLPVIRKSAIEEKDQILNIIISEVARRVSVSDFDIGMNNFINWIDDLITATRRFHPSTISVEKSFDSTDEISELIGTSSHKDELLRTLNDLKSSLVQAKRETFFLAQITVFQNLTTEGQTEFKAGVRTQDKLDELSRFDKRKLDKIIINPDHLRILLIQKLTQTIGMGRDRVSTLNDCRRVLNEFKNKLPQTMPLRSYIESLNLERKAREQSPVPIVLSKIIDFMSPSAQAQFKMNLKDFLVTMQSQWDEITKTETNTIVPLWVDQEEIEKQRLLDETESKKKAAEEEKRHKKEEAEKKEKEEKDRQEKDSKKSKIQKVKEDAAAKAKEKAKNAAKVKAKDLLGNILGKGDQSSGGDSVGGLLDGFSF